MGGYLEDPGRQKWYRLEYIDGTGYIRRVPEDEMEDIATKLHVTAAGDHCYNPTVVYAWCRENGVTVEYEIMERLIGRWALDHLDWTPDLPDGWDYAHGEEE